MSLNAAPQRGPLRAPEVSVLVIGVCSFSGLSRRSFSEGGRVELGAWSFPLPPERGALLRKLSSGTTTPVSPVSPSCVSLINFLFLIGNLRKSPEFVVFHWIQRHVAKKILWSDFGGFRRITRSSPPIVLEPPVPRLRDGVCRAGSRPGLCEADGHPARTPHGGRFEAWPALRQPVVPAAAIRHPPPSCRAVPWRRRTASRPVAFMRMTIHPFRHPARYSVTRP